MNLHSLHQVLVVENDAAIRDNLLELLESKGYRATGVCSIAETLLLPDLTGFAAVLLDWHLPDGTADELLPRILSRAPDAASIVVTGDADINAAIASLQHGAADYLVKPINPHCLHASLARIEQLHEWKRRSSQSERLATIGRAVTTVAHESRNALQSIQAQVDLMELDLDNDQESLNSIRVIKSASHRLLCLFEELREFAGPMVLHKERCQLRELVERAWQSLAIMQEARAAKFTCDLTDVEVFVDPMRFEQVFRNLFENAIAACPSPAKIDVSWSTEIDAGRKMLRIIVQDNGPGFSEQQKKKVFEPFYTTKNKGTGLGLPICNRILEQHQGRLEIGFSSGLGACMEIVLPLGAEPLCPVKTSRAIYEMA